jgi:hypothetical protein
MTIKTPPTKLDVKKDNVTKYEDETKDDGTPYGQGTYTYSHGDKYVGEYHDGEKNCQGTYTWADGEKYIDEFKYGFRNGKGTYTHLNEKNYIGEFEND